MIPSQGLPAAGATPLLPRWMSTAFVALGVLLVPWTLYLVLTLPSRTTAAHWRGAWVGFDVALATALVTTGVQILRRSTRTVVTSAVTATLLVCDAWFDVLTSHGTDTAFSVAAAVFVELPLAGCLLFVARRVEHVLDQGRRLLESAGSTVVAGRLVPPPRPTDWTTL